jgi:hypothetical protein
MPHNVFKKSVYSIGARIPEGHLHLSYKPTMITLTPLTQYSVYNRFKLDFVKFDSLQATHQSDSETRVASICLHAPSFLPLCVCVSLL